MNRWWDEPEAADRGARNRRWGRVALAAVLASTLLAGAGLLLGAGLAPSAVVAASLVSVLHRDLLDFPPLGNVMRRPDERSLVLAADGSVLAVLRAVNRKVTPLEEIPDLVQQAVIATEDTRFWTHPGVNWGAVGRAAITNLRAGEVTSGASTITQQLVKNLTGDNEPTLRRKLQEAVWAIELEQRVSKGEILERYLNETYFGNGVYGIATAAEYYFGKELDDVTVEEAALLAGLIRAPALNEPVGHPTAAVQRRNVVLRQMAAVGFLAEAEATRLAQRPLVLDLSPLPEARSPFFVAYVRHLLLDNPALGPDRHTREQLLLRGGLEVRTTLLPPVQRIADEAIHEVLPDRNGPQASLVAIDPMTGAIIAVGSGPKEFGRGPGRTQVTPAVPGVGSTFGRQPGSAFKAFEIVAALESGISPTFAVDTPPPYVPTGHCLELAPEWQPGNYSDGGTGTLDMAGATAVSSNVYFARLVDEFTGPQRLIDTARRMGITHSVLEPNCSAVLGTEEVYPLDMAAGFGTLANDGIHCAPYAIAEVRDRDGNLLLTGGNQCTRAVNEDIARRATGLLTAPIERGTAARHGQIGRPAAGKTGTTNDYHDAWFTGFIPQLAAATWVGYEQPATLHDPRCSGGYVTGGCLPTMIWQRFMREAVDVLALPVEGFVPPPPLPVTVVPDVVGQPVDSAQTTLRQAGLFPQVELVDDLRPSGTVVAQTPPAGATAEVGSAMRLRVSTGSISIPPAPPVLGAPTPDPLAPTDPNGSNA